MTADDFGSVDAFDSTADFILRLTGFSFSMLSFAELFLAPWPNVGWSGLGSVLKTLECFTEFSSTRTQM